MKTIAILLSKLLFSIALAIGVFVEGWVFASFISPKISGSIVITFMQPDGYQGPILVFCTALLAIPSILTLTRLRPRDKGDVSLGD